MASTPSDQQIDNSSMAASIVCAACSSSKGPFSKRQQKLASEGTKPARCTACIENGREIPQHTSPSLSKRSAEADSYPPYSAAASTAKAEVTLRHDTDHENTEEPEEDHNNGATFSPPVSDSDSDEKSRRDSEDVVGGEDATQMSLNAIKEQVLGRKFQTTHSSEDDSQDDANHRPRSRKTQHKKGDRNRSSSRLWSSHHSKAANTTTTKRSTSSSNKDSGSTLIASSLVSDSATHHHHLRQELTCAICHDILHQPISLPFCGHSFCQECFKWWMTHSPARLSKPSLAAGRRGRSSGGGHHQPSPDTVACPTCRCPFEIPFGGHHPDYQLCVNTALRACTETLFATELEERQTLERERLARATRGEDGGSHARGNEELTRERTTLSFAGFFGWMHNSKTNTSTGGTDGRSNGRHVQIPVDRAIVLDAEDQRMQFAFCFANQTSIRQEVVTSETSNTSSNSRTNTNSFYDPNNGYTDDEKARGVRLHIELALLTMEEDEVEDGGFPWILARNNGDVKDNDDYDRDAHSNCDDDALVVSWQDRPWIEATTRQGVPIARHRLGDNGRVTFLIDKETLDEHRADMLVFRDEKTGTSINITLPPCIFSNEKDSDEVNGCRHGSSQRQARVSKHGESGSDDDEEGADMNDYEDDGFVVADEEEEGTDDNSIDDEGDDDDPCCICQKGGELMVCDGGLNFIEGCGRPFHIACVGRDEVPPGDWVCELCASAHDMDVGFEGHEFPVTEELDQNRKRKRLSTDSVDVRSGSEEEEEGESLANENPARKRKAGENIRETNAEAQRTAKRKIILDDSSDDE